MSEEKRTILMVEDNRDISKLSRRILTHKGFEVEVIEDVESALIWCNDHVPDLILMDISLPGMDGLDVTRRLRKREAFAELPIVALTAHALNEWEEKCREAGCSGCISKPIIPGEFLKELKRYFT